MSSGSVSLPSLHYDYLSLAALLLNLSSLFQRQIFLHGKNVKNAIGLTFVS